MKPNIHKQPPSPKKIYSNGEKQFRVEKETPLEVAFRYFPLCEHRLQKLDPYYFYTILVGEHGFKVVTV